MKNKEDMCFPDVANRNLDDILQTMKERLDARVFDDLINGELPGIILTLQVNSGPDLERCLDVNLKQVYLITGPLNDELTKLAISEQFKTEIFKEYIKSPGYVVSIYFTLETAETEEELGIKLG